MIALVFLILKSDLSLLKGGKIVVVQEVEDEKDDEVDPLS